MTIQDRNNGKPDSEYTFRLVSGYDGHRLTWHTLECAVGRNAKHSRRTAYASAGARREAITERQGHAPYYHDHMAKCCIGKVDAEHAASPTFTAAQASRVFAAAHAAGMVAGTAHRPTPMIVGTPTTPLGNDIDQSQRTYHVPSGVCGFAWVVIKPGNCSLARHAKKLGIGRTSYLGGVEISIHDHGQSYECKAEHAAAYAAVLRDNGVEAYSNSRLD